MSILPSQPNQGSASDHSSPAPPNPSNHGFLPPAQQPPPPSRQQPLASSDPSVSPTDSSRALASLRISGHEASPSTMNAGSMAQTAPNDHGGSSRKVTGFGRPNDRNHKHHSSIGRKAEYPVREDGVAQPSTGRLSGSAGSPPNHRTSGSAGRRAQMVNGNHLLNFHYDPISRSEPRAVLAPSRRPRGTQKVKAFNKDLFVQANYKFVVLDAGNFDVEFMDPDKMLEWGDIICVKHSTPYPVQCPICLETPLCAQITSCGHIFCFPCILQYLLMGEENLKQVCWKKCPLCFVMISSKELYTIYIELVKHYRVGDTVEFTLLAREKDSYALYLKNQDRANAISFDLFSKFILTSDVELSVREAMCDLDSWLARADAGLVDDLEKLPYVCAAMEQLKKRKKYWNEHRISGGRKDTKNVGCDLLKSDNARPAINTIGVESLTSAVETHNIFVDNIEQDLDLGYCAIILSETEKAIDEKDYSLSSSYDKSTVEIQSCQSSSTKGKECYNFYQVIDGQNIIMHPLNMKCLLHHYGSYDLLPPRITGRILELESVTQSDAIRKRFRNLSHFPLTTTFQFCEIDMSGILPADSLSPFIDQIKKREKLRKQLAKKEQREKVKAEAVTAYYAPASSYSRSYYDDEPAFSMDDFEALGSDRSASTPSRSPHVYEERNLFSNVARLGFAAGHDSPSLNTREASTGSNMERTSSSTAPTGSGNQGVTSFDSVISRGNNPVETETRNVAKVNETKKGKKASRVLLSNAGIRRY